jgi:hypothetical protein
MPPQVYERDKNGIRLDLQGGMNTMLPPDLMQTGYPFLQNVRRNLAGRAIARPALGGNILTAGLQAGPTSMVLMNDPYLLNPPEITPNTYVLVIGAGGLMYVNSTQVASGLSTQPLSFVTYRPNATPQPWCYVADPSMAVTIPAGGISPGYPAIIYGNPIAGMLKVRSDNTVYKTGIAEPQIPPNISLTQGPGPNWTIYRYVYRCSITGALSNPSPESPAQVALQGTASGGPIEAQTLPTDNYNPAQYDPTEGPYLRTSGSVGAGVLTNYIYVTNFGLSVPPNVPIQGVQITMNWYGQEAGTGLLANVALYYQGSQIGAVKSPGISNTIWPSTPPTPNPPNTMVGSSIDTWGANLSPDVVNDPSFGFGVQIEAVESGGSNRSFIDSFSIEVFYQDQNATVTATASPDPQVDSIDFYRNTQGLANFTYVGTIANSVAATGLLDTLSDLAVATNPILQFDNYEPFPSIDLPHSGIANITAMNEEVSGVQIVYAGLGQTDGTYVIPSTGGGGTGATVQIVVSGGIIITATVLTAGSDYTSDPSFIVPASIAPPVTPPTPPNVVGILAAGIAPVDPSAPNVTWVSGDVQFNVRWLPGNEILLGTGQQNAWTLYARPVSPTQLVVYQSIIDPTTGIPTFSYPAAMSGATWSISEATLAAQPSPAIWGPTPDNQGSFYFGLDSLNPGDLLWSKGNNFDSAPDTNRMFVTSPSEVLQNGAITSELSTVFSTERFWLIYPDFANALATVTGTTGPQWTLIQAQATRGLYCPYAIAALGSMIAYRAKDCIAVSMGGGPEQTITDDIYNLFPHAGTTPQPVTVAGQTVFPPDDTKPNAQTITLTPTYLFYNYKDTIGFVRTLVYDLQAKGWSVDAYTPGANVHLWTVGAPGRLLLGCIDGTVRLLGGGGEAQEAIIVTRSENGGDARALKRVGDIFFRAELLNAFPVSLQLWQTQLTVLMGGFSPSVLGIGGTGGVGYYTVNFTSGFGDDVDDIGAVFSWALDTTNVIELWQPSWTQLPEIIQDRPSDWTECGIIGNKLIRGMIIEMDSFNAVKAIQVERSDSATLIVPNQASVIANGQTLVPFTFTPFTAHMLRIVSTDGVPWRMFGADAQWICDPWPDYTPLFSAWSNLGADGAKYLRSLLIPMDTNGAMAEFQVQTSDGPSRIFFATTQPAVKTPVAFAFVPPLVVHDVQVQCESNAALWPDEVKWEFDPYPEIIPAYTPIMEVNGSGNKYVRGINITADTANTTVEFQVLTDGGASGPNFTGTFNGKQTIAFPFDPPFIAHDLQLIPTANARIFLQESQWTMDPWPDYITIYSPWMNLGRNEPKYIRSLTLPLDTHGTLATFKVITSDGGSVSFSATTTSAVKSPVGFAFTPPIIAHEVQIIMESNAAMWPEEAQWEFDNYPELIPALTPIMELSGPDNKFFQGIKIIGDSAGQPVTFQVLFDGGQIGPVIGPLTFNGKQTQVWSFDPPFYAYDVQLVPQESVRLWMPGMGGDDSYGESAWVTQPAPDAGTGWTTEFSSLGLFGWCFIYQVNLAYTSATPVTFTVNTDQGSFALTFPPSTGGATSPSKVLAKCPRNKWKLVSFSVTSSAAFQLWQNLTEVWVRSWGETSEFHKINPFGGPSSPAAPI